MTNETASLLDSVKFGIPAKWLTAWMSRINCCEFLEIRKRRQNLNFFAEEKMDMDAVGLALSGGGIRSATFCLGFIQVLAERDFLTRVDFLSTVSGGGYTGCFITTQLQKNGMTGDRIKEDLAYPYGPDTECIKHVRHYARYLSSSSAWERWGTLTKFIRGSLINWTAPLFFLSLLAIGAVYLTDGINNLSTDLKNWCDHQYEWNKPLCDKMIPNQAADHEKPSGSQDQASKQQIEIDLGQIRSIFWSFICLLFFILLIFYIFVATPLSYKGKSWPDKFLAWVFLIPLILLGCWALQIGYDQYFAPIPENPNWRWLGGSLSISSMFAALPVFSKAIPFLNRPRQRRIVRVLCLYALGLLVPLLAILIFYALCFIGTIGNNHYWWWNVARNVPGPSDLLWYILIVSGGMAFSLLNINLTSLHRFYRDQLAKTFITPDTIKRTFINSKERPNKASTPNSCSLNSGRSNTTIFNNNETPTLLKDLNCEIAPYHLINATVNLPSSGALTLWERKCDFFLFSKHYCGSPVCGYHLTEEWFIDYGKSIDIATAMAISGAAVAPKMGLRSIPALSSLLSLLNLRLSFWIRNPGKNKSHKLNWLKWLWGVPGFFCLMREMFSFRMNEESEWLNLSDGGHIENLGVYELLRRRCKFIICIDAEADPDHSFGGLMTLIRHAQIDFGIRILADSVSLEKLQCGHDGLSEQSAALFKVEYPKHGSEDNHEYGLMLYIKLAVTGEEPPLVNQYRRMNPEFPHQSTLDQSFDQEQFEVYRQLGVYAAEGVFQKGDQAPRGVDPAGFWFRNLIDRMLPDTTTA